MIDQYSHCKCTQSHILDLEEPVQSSKTNSVASKMWGAAPATNASKMDNIFNSSNGSEASSGSEASKCERDSIHSCSSCGIHPLMSKCY